MKSLTYQKHKPACVPKKLAGSNMDFHSLVTDKVSKATPYISRMTIPQNIKHTTKAMANSRTFFWAKIMTESRYLKPKVEFKKRASRNYPHVMI